MTNWKEVNPWRRYGNDDFLKMGKQALAMRRVNQAVKNGTLVRLSKCEVCNTECKTVAHHWAGYDFPFEVWWICRVCNRRIKEHDGSMSLEQARVKFQNKMAAQMDGERGVNRAFVFCAACGVRGRRGDMQKIQNDGIYCQSCYESITC